MDAPFDLGYTHQPYVGLVAACPGAEVFPPGAFRVEWGPVFHRGRLDGSARVLVVGQDPAAHEAVCRRILVGAAGRRTQGLLGRLGITRSYVLVNTFAYSVLGQSGGEQHVDDPGIVAYRHSWLDALAGHNDLDAIVSLGRLADTAVRNWLTTPAGKACTAAYVTVRHPTSRDESTIVGTWNEAIAALRTKIRQDVPTPVRRYQDTVDEGARDIPAADLPAGLPAWMATGADWAVRDGRETLTVTVPVAARTWPRPG